MSRKLTILSALAVVMLAAMPVTGHERIGSVISSFNAIEGDYYPSGLVRTSEYVIVSSTRPSLSYTSFFWYTSSGSLVDSYEIGQIGKLTGGDTAHLGDGYVAFMNAINQCSFWTLKGTMISGFNVNATGTDPYDFFWDGTHYQFESVPERLWRFTPAGSLAGSWTPPAWPTYDVWGLASLSKFNNVAGSYIVTTDLNSGAGTVMTLSGGSLVATFEMAPGVARGACGGRAARPGRYGEVLWILGADYWVYQIDMGNGPGNAVEPASLGAVKALFR